MSQKSRKPSVPAYDTGYFYTDLTARLLLSQQEAKNYLDDQIDICLSNNDAVGIEGALQVWKTYQFLLTKTPLYQSERGFIVQTGFQIVDAAIALNTQDGHDVAMEALQSIQKTMLPSDMREMTQWQNKRKKITPTESCLEDTLTSQYLDNLQEATFFRLVIDKVNQLKTKRSHDRGPRR
jgi:hypothetical protein